MRAIELRINNIIYFEFNGKRDIHYVVPKDIHVMNLIETESKIELGKSEESECYNPIPLTEEWLLKFGFRKTQSEYWISLTNLKAELYAETYSKEIVWIIKTDFTELILDSIKSVHQLQNLYFALTGEELKMN